MNSYTVKIDTEAFIDIKEAAYWYNKKGDGLGDRFKNQVKVQIDSLEHNADIYRTRYRNVRYVLVKKFPFVIHFVIDKKSNIVQVVAVVHTSRDPKVWEQKIWEV